MVNELYYYISNSNNPYINLAIEKYMCQSIKKGQCIIYLWQNANTVVVGKNQNIWKECRVEELLKNEGFPARRESGGGTVYHDIGNLNFTFILNTKDYNLDKQLSVIQNALSNFSIKSVRSGRNDIEINGKKFSGNAFFNKNGKSYHHGTLLVDVDMQSLEKYLTIPQKKMKSKGIDSFISRVVNLKEVNNQITIENLKQALLTSFKNIYNHKLQPHPNINNDIIEKYMLELSSKEWLYGYVIEFTLEIEKKFSWGEIQLQLLVNKGRIEKVHVFTDAMDVDFSAELESNLKNKEYSSQSIIKILDKMYQNNLITTEMKLDMENMVKEQFDINNVCE